MPLIELEQESLSPRLAWLAKHRLHTAKDVLPRGSIGPYDTKPWRCSNAGRTISGFGDTEEEATFEAARIFHIEHWLEAELREQTAPRVIDCEDEFPCPAQGDNWTDRVIQMHRENRPRVVDTEE